MFSKDADFKLYIENGNNCRQISIKFPSKVKQGKKMFLYRRGKGSETEIITKNCFCWEGKIKREEQQHDKDIFKMFHLSWSYSASPTKETTFSFCPFITTNTFRWDLHGTKQELGSCDLLGILFFFCVKVYQNFYSSRWDQETLCAVKVKSSVIMKGTREWHQANACSHILSYHNLMFLITK